MAWPKLASSNRHAGKLGSQVTRAPWENLVHPARNIFADGL